MPKGIHPRQPEAKALCWSPWCLFTETFILFPNQIFNFWFPCEFHNDMLSVTSLIPRSFQISSRFIAWYCCVLSWDFFFNFGGHKSFSWGHWYPCFGLLVTSVLGFKARVYPFLPAFYYRSYWYPYTLRFWILPFDRLCDDVGCYYQFDGVNL